MTIKEHECNPTPLCLLYSQEQLPCHSPSSLENVRLRQVCLRPLLSQLLNRSLTTVVLKQPETPADESLSSLAAPHSLTSLISSCSFRTSAISRDVDTATKLLAAAAPRSRGGWFWGWEQDCIWEPHHWLCREPFSEATALLLRHSGLCPLKGHGALLPLSSSLPCKGGVSASHSSFYLVCSFSYISPGSLEKVVGSGFDRGKTNKRYINKGGRGGHEQG